MDNKLLCDEGPLTLQIGGSGIHLLTDTPFPIAIVPLKYRFYEQNRANAERIVLAWNCHDDLYNALNDLLLSHYKLSGGLLPTEAEKQAEAALLKANKNFNP